MKNSRILLTLTDDRNRTSETVHPSFRDATQHGDEMLSCDIGWVGYTATDGSREITRTLTAIEA